MEEKYNFVEKLKEKLNNNKQPTLQKKQDFVNVKFCQLSVV